MPPFQEQGLQPAPQAPEQGLPAQDPSAPMTPEHRAELLELLAKVKQEYSKWKSMSFGMKNTANEAKRDQLRAVFQMLQAKGVDLNDRESVARFLSQLKETNPQHFEAITRALDYLLGSDYEKQEPPQEAPEQPPVV